MKRRAGLLGLLRKVENAKQGPTFEALRDFAAAVIVARDTAEAKELVAGVDEALGTLEEAAGIKPE